MSDYTSFTTASLMPMPTSVDMSDRFAWGQNLISDDFSYSCFGGKMTAFSTAPLRWTTIGMASEDEDFFRLLNATDYGADEANAMLDVVP